MKIILFILSLIGLAMCDHLPVPETTPEPPPHPYSFAYTAGRFPGHVDRTHAEAGDGSGVVRGMFAYIDPLQHIRTVEYIADKQGFHPILSDPVSDTPTVAAAKQRHAELYNRIAAGNEGLAPVYVPSDTSRVAAAKVKHATLFEKIAQEHARIAAEREAIQATDDYNTLRNQY